MYMHISKFVIYINIINTGIQNKEYKNINYIDMNILSNGYNVYLRYTESNIKWDENIELSKKQEIIRNLVYKNR